MISFAYSRPNHISNMKLILVVGGFFFLTMAATTSLQLHDDSFAHFVISLQTLTQFDFTRFVLDTWNRPLTTLLYGTAGQLGILSARAVSVVLILSMAFFVHRSAEYLLKKRFPPIALLAFVLAQSAILTHAHLTMTEQIAAFFLALGIFLAFSGKFYLSAITLGLMPLARAETVLIMVWISIWMVILGMKDRGKLDGLWRIVKWSCLAWFPFVLWWTAGFSLKGELGWMTPSYVYFRSFTFNTSWLINGITGLPSALQGPLLYLFIIGLFSLIHSVLFNAETEPENKVYWNLVIGGVIIHLVFVSIVVVYPKDSGFSEIGVVAINYRNFNSITPLLSLIIYSGAYFLTTHNPFNRRIRFGVWLTSLFLLSGFFVFHWRLKSNPDPIIGAWCVVQATFCTLILWWSHYKICNRARWWSGVATICVLAGFISYPFYWYPLRFQDRTEVMHRELGEWLKQNYTKPWPTVIQDLSGNGVSEWLWGVDSGATIWLYPAQFERKIAEAPIGTLIVLETDSFGNLMPRYSKKLKKLLQGSLYEEVAMYQPKKSLNVIEKLLTSLSGYNKLTGWLVFKKLSSQKV